MAIYTSITIDGKLIPISIQFNGTELDQGKGTIEVIEALRTSDGKYGNTSTKYYDLPNELSFVSSDNVNGLQVLTYLAEWFDSKHTTPTE